MKTKEIKQAIQISRPTTLFILIGFSILCISIGLILSVKVFHKIEHLSFPVKRQTNSSLIQLWMTLPYISRTYGIPMEVFKNSLDIQSDTNRRANLESIAKQNGKDPQFFLNEVRGLVTSFHAEHPFPPSIKP